MLLDINKFIKLVQRYGVAESFVLMAIYTGPTMDTEKKCWTPLSISQLSRDLGFIKRWALNNHVNKMVKAGILEKKTSKGKQSKAYYYHIASREAIDMVKEAIVECRSC